MNLPALCAAWLAFPIHLPAGIDSTQVELGRELVRKGNSIDRLERPVHMRLGEWFDGSKRREVEYAIWLSPEYLMRRLGAESAVYRWTENELEDRWFRLRLGVQRRDLFVVRLASLERQDPLELSNPIVPSEKGLESVSFEFRVKDVVVPGEVLSCVEAHSSGAFGLQKRPWSPILASLPGLEPASVDGCGPDIPLGSNRIQTYVVATELPEGVRGMRLNLIVHSRKPDRHGSLLLVRG